MIEEKYRVVAEFVESGVPAIQRTGLKVLEMREGYAKARMPLEGNVNHVGIMYAGALFTLGEAAGGILHGVAFDCRRFFPIVKEVSIRFRRPAGTDVILEVGMSPGDAGRIQQEAEERGKADFTLDLEIKDSTGEVVSTVRGTWQIRRIPEGMPPPLPVPGER